MKLKFPMYQIGVAPDTNQSVRIAVLQKTSLGWTVVHCEHLSPGQGFQYKANLLSRCTYSLSGSDSLVRSSYSLLKRKQNILNVALNNLETYTALSKDTVDYFAQFGRKKEGTPLTLWIAKKNTILNRLDRLHTQGIFPQHLSSHSADLFYLAERSPLNKLPTYFLVYEGMLETTCLFIHEHTLMLARSFPNLSKEKLSDILDTLNHVRETFPKALFSEVHVAYLEEETKQALQKHAPLHHCSLIDSHEDYRDAIAAAFRGSTKQPGFTLPLRDCSKLAKHHWLKKALLSVSVWTLAITSLTAGIAYLKRDHMIAQTQENFALIYPEGPKLSSRLLQAKKNLLTAATHEKIPPYAYLPTIPSHQEVLQFLGSLSSHFPSIRFSQFRYVMTSFPTDAHPSTPYEARVELKGSGIPEELSAFLCKAALHKYLRDVSTSHTNPGQFELHFVLREK